MSDESTESEKLLEDENKTQSDKKLSPGIEKLLFASILSAQFVSICQDTFLFPFFPQEANKKGLNSIHIGLIFSCFEVSRFISSLAVGYLIVKLNPRLWCLVGSLLTTVTCISFGLASYAPDSIFLGLCIVIRLLAGAASSCLNVAGMSILLKKTSYHSNTIATVVQMTATTAYASGSAVGSLLFEVGGYGCMFWTFGCIMAVVHVAQIFIVPKIEQAPQPKKSVLYLLKIGGIIIIYMNYFIYRVIDSARSAGMSEFITSTFQKSPSIVGLCFGGWALIFLACCPLIAKLPRMGYIFSLMVCAWVTSVFVYSFLGPSPLLDFLFHGNHYFPLTVALVGIQNIAEVSIYVPPFQGALNLAEVNGHQSDSIQVYGAVAGLINSAKGFGGMFGSFMSGVITEELSYSWTTTVLAGLAVFMLITLVTYLVYMKLTQQPLSPKDQKYLSRKDPSEKSALIANKLEECFDKSATDKMVAQQVQPEQEE